MTLLVIEATVTDPVGATGTGSVTVEVLDPPAALPPGGATSLLVIEATVSDVAAGTAGRGSVTVEVIEPLAEMATKAAPASQRESLPAFAERSMQRWGQVR